MKGAGWVLAVVALAVASAALAQDRATKVRGDRARVEASGFWIYDDLRRAFAEAGKANKPVLVVFRCIPCEHCAQIDQQLVDRDPAIQKLLEQFVCVRVVHANGMDLTRFQYDYDQSWAAFFMNADRTIYGRYGTRSHRTESANDMTLAGFGKALQGALELHRQYPRNRPALAGKQSIPADAPFPVPEEAPSLKGKYKATIDYEGQVVQSCIHCHQVGEALRLSFRSEGKPIPERVLYPYPNPKILGLVVDPATRSTLKRVMPGSSGEKDGFKSGDEITTLDGPPVLSTADLQWVLHHAGASGSLKAEVRRGGKTLPLTLTLGPGWRQRDDISWRATSWDLRRMTTGGLSLEEASAEERQAAGLPEGALALRVKNVGQYGPHAAAKQAGFQQGDLLVTVDSRSNQMSESQLMAFLVNAKRPGDRVLVTVLRKGERVELMLPMQ